MTTNSSETGQEQKEKFEAHRQEMIAQSRDHLSAVFRMRQRLDEREKELFEERLAVDELVITWLERLAAMMRVDVTRLMMTHSVSLVWADTDGDPVTDESGDVLHYIESFDDITQLVVSKQKGGNAPQ